MCLLTVVLQLSSLKKPSTNCGDFSITVNRNILYRRPVSYVYISYRQILNTHRHEGKSKELSAGIIHTQHDSITVG